MRRPFMQNVHDVFSKLDKTQFVPTLYADARLLTLTRGRQHAGRWTRSHNHLDPDAPQGFLSFLFYSSLCFSFESLFYFSLFSPFFLLLYKFLSFCMPRVVCWGGLTCAQHMKTKYGDGPTLRHKVAWFIGTGMGVVLPTATHMSLYHADGTCARVQHAMQSSSLPQPSSHTPWSRAGPSTLAPKRESLTGGVIHVYMFTCVFLSHDVIQVMLDDHP